MTKSKFLIIGDSSLDLDDKLRERLGVVTAPLSINLGETTYIDNDRVNMEDFWRHYHNCKDTPRTAAPSPGAFLDPMKEAQEGVFIITLSSKLSGSYNAAMLAKELAREQYPHLKVHVIDSLAASSGQTTIAIKIKECIKSGMTFEQIAAVADEFRDHDKLYFLLDNIEVLVKNGRMSLLKGMMAMLLRIKPILGADGEGNICLEDKTRSSSRALDKLASLFINISLETESRTLVIAHCQAIERARLLKDKIAASRQFKEIIIVPMQLLSSTYANIGGLVCAC